MSVTDERSEHTEGEHDPLEGDPRAVAARAIAGGDRGLEMVAHAAQGAELSDAEEISALGYLLGAPKPVIHEIEITYETEAGMAPLWFVVRSIDTKKIDKIEQRHSDERTGLIDRITADAQIVAEATIYIRDATGEKVEINSDTFLTVLRPDGRGGTEPFTHAAPPLALEERFRDQMGLISGVVLEIKRASGFSADRVKRAKRLLAASALG